MQEPWSYNRGATGNDLIVLSDLITGEQAVVLGLERWF
jgi:hypothetical protein